MSNQQLIRALLLMAGFVGAVCLTAWAARP